MRYDTIVLGLGGMGSAVAAHASRRGQRVLGLERFGPAHKRGSSHGETRIIRQAYFESPDYVPMLQRAYVLWDELAVRSETRLRDQTGGLFVGRPDAKVVAGTLASARRWNLAHEIYDAAEMRRSFPVTPYDDEIGVFEAIAGVVFPEAGVRAHLRDALENGAALRFGARVMSWEANDGGIKVALEDGEQVVAARIAICAGPWFAKIAPDLDLPLRVERNVQFWFMSRNKDAVGPDRLPVYVVERDGGPIFYGFPDFDGRGAKIAHHGSGQLADPDSFARGATQEEIAVAEATLESFVPLASDGFARADPCMYTLTPDEHFVIGAHPRHANVIVAGGFSGHGYKFTPVVGEIVAALLAGEDPGFNLDIFSPTRFSTSA